MSPIELTLFILLLLINTVPILYILVKKQNELKLLEKMVDKLLILDRERECQ